MPVNSDVLKAKRRRVLCGFPREVVFKSYEELDEYLNGDEQYLQCLLCGKQYRLLSGHLRQTHDISDNEYKRIYGIPYTRGLACKDLRDIQRDNCNAKRLINARFREQWKHISPEKRRMYKGTALCDIVKDVYRNACAENARKAKGKKHDAHWTKNQSDGLKQFHKKYKTIVTYVERGII